MARGGYNFQAFLPGVRFAPFHKTMDAKTRAMGKPALRRKSMELLKDITQILREILSSGDEEGLRQFEKTIRALEQTRHKPGSHAIH
jgi:hypothetical protein